jgi:hypothetical protein
MRLHGNYNLRLMKHHLRPGSKSGRSMTTEMTMSTAPLRLTGGSVYSEQLSKTVSNMPELNKRFGGLMSKKKTKKVFLKL